MGRPGSFRVNYLLPETGESPFRKKSILGKRIRPKPYPSPETPTVVQGGFRAHIEDSPHHRLGSPLGELHPPQGRAGHCTSTAPAEAADIRRGVYMLPAMVLISAPARACRSPAGKPKTWILPKAVYRRRFSGPWMAACLLGPQVHGLGHRADSRPSPGGAR
jgi:hypothetical protein